MKETRLLMGMPITIEIVDQSALYEHLDRVFDYFNYIDNTFSTYKETSEMSKINRGLIKKEDYSRDMQTVLQLCQQTKEETSGFFDIKGKDGQLDPSGLVKGWAIKEAAMIVKELGYVNYYVEAGGDIEMSGKNAQGSKWRVGIRNPFNRRENVKVLYLTDCGIATSGTYIRGQHVYDPHQYEKETTDIVSLTVVGPNVYEADRMVTAAFAMGKKGIEFIANLKGIEGYMINANKSATATPWFNRFLTP